MAARAPASPRKSLAPPLAPEACLEHALRAKTAAARATWAERGLGHRGGIERSTKAMLLRQLYLAYYTSGHYRRAYDIALQAAELAVLEDVVQQDCARALQAAGDLDGAARHLRLAARRAPPSRRAFHWWTLGSLMFLAQRHDEAVAALGRAVRWGTRDKPLYQGHLALAKLDGGTHVRGLGRLIARLAACPAGQGYGRFVLGELCYRAARPEVARAYLTSFVERTERGHKAMAIALAGELARARTTLAALRASDAS